MSLFYTSVRWCVSLRGLFQHVWTCLRRNVCYVLRRTHGRFSALHAPINTKSERLPQASPPPPPPPPNPPSPATSTTLSVGKPHWNVFKRHSSSHKQASSSTGMWGGDNGEGGGGCICTQKAFVSFGGNKVCLCVCEHLCVFEPFLISEQWVHTVRGGNQYQLSSSTKGVKRSIPPQHDNSSSQAWLIQMSVWSTTGTLVRKRSEFG